MAVAPPGLSGLDKYLHLVVLFNSFAREQEVTWPRELYLNVLGCKALVPHSSATSEETPTATASVTTDGDTGDRTASPPAVGGTSNGSGGSGNPRSTGGMSGSGDSSGGDPCCDNDEPPPGGALGAAAVDALAAAADSGDGGDGDEESVRMGEDADSRESSSAEREKVQDDSGNELMAGVSSSAEGGEKEEIRGECFVRVHNATTGRDLQVETDDRSTYYFFIFIFAFFFISSRLMRGARCRHSKKDCRSSSSSALYSGILH